MHIRSPRSYIYIYSYVTYLEQPLFEYDITCKDNASIYKFAKLVIHWRNIPMLIDSSSFSSSSPSFFILGIFIWKGLEISNLCVRSKEWLQFEVFLLGGLGEGGWVWVWLTAMVIRSGLISPFVCAREAFGLRFENGRCVEFGGRD